MEDMWTRLRQRARETESRSILSLFEHSKDRFAAFSAQCGDVLVDISKTNIDRQTLALLIDLAKGRGVAGRRDAMFRGDAINVTENRAVLHWALRADDDAVVRTGGVDVMPQIVETRECLNIFASKIRSGDIRATGGEGFTDIINIGIGGSDLGPAMAVAALSPYHDGPRCHFVSNVDAADISGVLGACNAQTTLVNIASKTFTTTETMENAKTARAWLGRSLGDKAGGHMCAVSSAIDRAQAFGVPLDRVFGFGDFIGGRLSLWGPVGLPILLAIGPERFRSFLSGAQAMDLHFRETPFERNLPVLLALSGIWHRNFCGYHSRAILPYDQRLHLLPAYLQQLDMESNGKCVTLANTGVEHETGPVVWGQPGTNGQHAFFQLLHQGSDIVPAEFLIAARGFEPELGHHHDLLVANCLAQSEALMRGRSEAEARDLARREGLKGDALDMQARHRAFEGNRPSVAIAYPRLTPFVLGQIIALYEHRVFVEGAIWNINSFDQWGVELGKELAGEMLPLVKGGAATGKDASTRGLLSHLARGQREEPEKP